MRNGQRTVSVKQAPQMAQYEIGSVATGGSNESAGPSAACSFSFSAPRSGESFRAAAATPSTLAGPTCSLDVFPFGPLAPPPFPLRPAGERRRARISASFLRLSSSMSSAATTGRSLSPPHCSIALPSFFSRDNSRGPMGDVQLGTCRDSQCIALAATLKQLLSQSSQRGNAPWTIMQRLG